MRKTNVLMAVLLGLGAGVVQAHDAWVVPAGGEYRVLYGYGADTLGL